MAKRELERTDNGPARILSLWDQLTLFEARLLLGDWEGAKEEYRLAMKDYALHPEPLELARTQAKKNLAALNRLDLLATIFP